MKTFYEWTCKNGHEGKSDEYVYECPECGCERISKWLYGICENCGEEIPLGSFTNECDCGALYNNFGQRLADPEEWDAEDRYACIGPLTEALDW